MSYVKSCMVMKLVPKCVKFTYKLVRTFLKCPPIDFRVKKSEYK